MGRVNGCDFLVETGTAGFGIEILTYGADVPSQLAKKSFSAKIFTRYSSNLGPVLIGEVATQSGVNGCVLCAYNMLWTELQ